MVVNTWAESGGGYSLIIISFVIIIILGVLWESIEDNLLINFKGV